MEAIPKAVSPLLIALNYLFLEQKLADLSTVPTARLIDGILLTKFDTIDDKVGGKLAHNICSINHCNLWFTVF